MHARGNCPIYCPICINYTRFKICAQQISQWGCLWVVSLSSLMLHGPKSTTNLAHLQRMAHPFVQSMLGLAGDFKQIGPSHAHLSIKLENYASLARGLKSTSQIQPYTSRATHASIFLPNILKSFSYIPKVFRIRKQAPGFQYLQIGPYNFILTPSVSLRSISFQPPQVFRVKRYFCPSLLSLCA